MSEVLRNPWRGINFTLARDITLPARGHRQAKILLRNGTLPDEGGLDSLNIESLKTNGKSRGAQLGFAPAEDSSRLIASQIRAQGLEGAIGATLEAEVTIFNYAERPMQLPEGGSIGKFYRPGEFITGEELADNAASFVTGKAWGLVYANSIPRERETSDIEGIWVKIHGKERYMAPAVNPVKVRDILEAQDYRRAVDKLLVPAVNVDHTILIIGETSVEIGMPEGIDAEIDGSVVSDINNPQRSWIGRHINALLLEGGKPKWPIRTEVLGKVMSNGVEKFIIMRFRRAALASQGQALRA